MLFAFFQCSHAMVDVLMLTLILGSFMVWILMDSFFWLPLYFHFLVLSVNVKGSVVTFSGKSHALLLAAIMQTVIAIMAIVIINFFILF